MTTTKPRQYTVEEQRNMFLNHLRSLVHYCEHETRSKTSKEKLDMLAFSFLTMIDGVSSEMPGFDLVPRTDASDPECHRDHGENWWPSNAHLDDIDGYEPINGGEHFHDLFFAKKD